MIHFLSYYSYILFGIYSLVLFSVASTNATKEGDSSVNNIISVIEKNITSSRQLNIPSLDDITERIPCECNKGICKCCTPKSTLFFGTQGCAEMLYIPEDFSFEMRMKINKRVLFKRTISGKNPPPICVAPPAFPFARACVTFYDVYFFGRNMHICMDIGGFVQGYELFSQSFNCLMLGSKGVRVVKPGEAVPVSRPPPDVIDVIDDDDEIEDYDENVVRTAINLK